MDDLSVAVVQSCVIDTAVSAAAREEHDVSRLSFADFSADIIFLEFRVVALTGISYESLCSDLLYRRNLVVDIVSVSAAVKTVRTGSAAYICAAKLFLCCLDYFISVCL